MDELKAYRNWVVTTLPDKIPLNPKNGSYAETDDPITWADYGMAQSCVEQNPKLMLGFVLTNTPYSCVDLDTYKTTDEAIIAEHKRIYESFNTYSELSPSKGVHIWCKGTLPDNKRYDPGFVEMYSSKHYIIVTDTPLNTFAIEPRQKELDQLFFLLSQLQNKLTSPLADDLPDSMPDDDLCRRAWNAINGKLFMDLYQGNWQLHYPSQSEADQAFVDIVAFYTESRTQVSRIFHNCALGKRKKAFRRDYLYHPKFGIITRAFDQKKPNIDLTNLKKVMESQLDDQRRKLISLPIMSPEDRNGYHKQLTKLPEFVRQDLTDFKFDRPPGLVGDIAQFIYRNSPLPVKEIAIGAAIAFFAGLCGRQYNVSNTGLNHYVALLGPTGCGKEAAASGIERLVSYIREVNPSVDQFIGPAEISSPQALIKHLANISPCFISHKGEMGLWMQKITNKYANANDAGIRQLMLDVFMKSGKGCSYRGIIYADKSKDVHPIQSPAFTLLGDATPSTFYRAVDEENIEEGFVSRFTIVEVDTDDDPPFNHAQGTIVPDTSLITSLSGIIRRAVIGQKFDEPILIQHTPGAMDAQTKFWDECRKKRNEDPDTPEAKIYTRAHFRLLRLSGLLAVGIDHDNPIITEEIVDWARKFVVQGIARVTWRFEKGEVGQRNTYVEQQKALKQILRSYWDNGWKDSLIMDGIDKPMYDVKLITHRFIHRRISGYAAFRHAHNIKLDLNNNLQELADAGILCKINMGTIRDSGRIGAAYYILDYNSLMQKPRK